MANPRSTRRPEASSPDEPDDEVLQRRGQPEREEHFKAAAAYGDVDSFKVGGWYKRHMLALQQQMKDRKRAPSLWMAWPDAELAGVLHELVIRFAKGDFSILVLHGPRGTGKTQLACDIGWMFARRQLLGRTPIQIYRRWDEFADNLRREFDFPTREPDSWRNRARTAALLVLDELQDGKLAESEWEQRVLTQILDVRYGNFLRTILVTNCDLKGLQELIGPSAWSRVCEVGETVELKTVLRGADLEELYLPGAGEVGASAVLVDEGVGSATMTSSPSLAGPATERPAPPASAGRSSCEPSGASPKAGGSHAGETSRRPAV